MDRPEFAVAVNLALIDADQRLLFHRRANTGYCDGQLALLGGHVEKSESSVQACVRELHEEGSLLLNASRFFFDRLMHKLDIDGENRFDIFFKVHISDAEKSAIKIGEPHKCSELIWLNSEESSHHNIVPYVETYVQSKKDPYSGLMLFGF
ncbi:MAG: NUDIX domain-containing protein [Rhizobiaceae bacterium]